MGSSTVRLAVSVAFIGSSLVGISTLALLIGAIAIIVAGFLWYSDREARGKYMQSTDNAYVKQDMVAVAAEVGGRIVEVGVAEVAGAITPVPGGTGPVTNMMLLRNVLAAAREQSAGDRERPRA